MLNLSLWDLLRVRFHQGHRTIDRLPVLPDRFRGRPCLDYARCTSCGQCAAACPTQAIEGLILDLGRCLFCGACADACPSGAISFTREHRLATRSLDALRLGKGDYELATSLEKKLVRLFGRSLKLRQVSAGGCNACEADTNALGNVVYDLGRFGIQFVASPRHADGLLVTGPVSERMREALIETYRAVPSPKIVIAVGSCAISGGIFRDRPEVAQGLSAILPVDLYIPGCPPHPLTILDGLLRLVGRKGIPASEVKA